MFDSIALNPSVLSNEAPAPRRGLWTLVKAAMEALVSAQARRFEGNDSPLLYRFPPI
jgi:hypothetical protein